MAKLVDVPIVLEFHRSNDFAGKKETTIGKIAVSFPTLGNIMKPINLTVSKEDTLELNTDSQSTNCLGKQFKEVVKKAFKAYWSKDSVQSVTIELNPTTVIPVKHTKSEEVQTKKEEVTVDYKFD